jgi:nicotinamidase-related amidase
MTRAALLLMDLQSSMVGRMGSPELLAAVQRAAGAARRARVPVIYVRVAFRPGHPEISPANRAFSRVADSGGMVDGDEATGFPAEIAPRDGDLVVTKKRVSAFTGSDLEVILRGQGVDHLVLAGIATSGVVLSTYVEAADRDYGLTVLRDACADGAPELACALLDQLFPRGADVTTVDAWAAELAA